MIIYSNSKNTIDWQDIEVEQHRTHSMLQALLKANNVKWEDQDQFIDRRHTTFTTLTTLSNSGKHF